MKEASEGTGLGQIQVVAGAFELAGAGEGRFFHQVVEIAGGSIRASVSLL